MTFLVIIVAVILLLVSPSLFASLFGIIFLILAAGFSIIAFSAFKDGDIEEGFKYGIPAAILLFILFKAIF